MLNEEEIKNLINEVLFEKGLISEETYKCSKPHISSLPYDNRTTDPVKLQERKDVIDERMADVEKEYDRLVSELNTTESNIEDNLDKIDNRIYEYIEIGEVEGYDDEKFNEDYNNFRNDYDDFVKDWIHHRDSDGTEKMDSKLFSSLKKNLNKVKSHGYLSNDFKIISDCFKEIEKEYSQRLPLIKDRDKSLNIYNDLQEELDKIP